MSSHDWTDNGFRAPEGPGEWLDETVGPTAVEERADAAGGDQDSLARYDRSIYADDYVEIPGYGESGPHCGEYAPAAVCDSCGETEFTPHVCGRRTCEDCWWQWVRESARKATLRVQAFRLTQPANARRQVVHAVYSPDETPATVREFLDLRSGAYEEAKAKGIRGGVAVLHGYRLTEAAQERYERVEPEMGKWQWVRETYGDDWREAVYWSPHVHIVGAATPDMEPGEGDDVWRVIRSVTSLHGATDRQSHNDVFRLICYLLTHAAVPTESTKSFTSRTWFGELHGSVFDPEEELASRAYRHLVAAVEEVATGAITEEEVAQYREEEKSPEEGACPCDDCDGQMIDVLRADEWLRQAEPPPDVRRRLEACYEYRMGRLQAPPGLRRPTTVEAARELIEELE